MARLRAVLTDFPRQNESQVTSLRTFEQTLQEERRRDCENSERLRLLEQSQTAKETTIRELRTSSESLKRQIAEISISFEVYKKHAEEALERQGSKLRLWRAAALTASVVLGAFLAYQGGQALHFW